MRFAYPAVLLCAAACASAPSASRSAVTNSQPNAGSLAAPAAASRTRGTIITGSFTTEYFLGENLHDVLRRRVPLYLRPRSIASFDVSGNGDPIAVYIDGSFAGSLDVLSLIPASEVVSVKRMPGTEAMVKFGPKHGNGALLVTMIRR